MLANLNNSNPDSTAASTTKGKDFFAWCLLGYAALMILIPPILARSGYFMEVLMFHMNPLTWLISLLVGLTLVHQDIKAISDEISGKKALHYIAFFGTLVVYFIVRAYRLKRGFQGGWNFVLLSCILLLFAFFFPVLPYPVFP